MGLIWLTELMELIGLMGLKFALIELPTTSLLPTLSLSPLSWCRQQTLYIKLSNGCYKCINKTNVSKRKKLFDLAYYSYVFPFQNFLF